MTKQSHGGRMSELIQNKPRRRKICGGSIGDGTPGFAAVRAAFSAVFPATHLRRSAPFRAVFSDGTAGQTTL
jgi:hypothetical protein